MSELIFNAERLIFELQGSPLECWASALSKAVTAQGHALKHGHLPRWNLAVESLPDCDDTGISVVDGAVTLCSNIDGQQATELHQALVDLSPWRKGPFCIGPHFIDTEWHSDWKWDRIEPHLKPLNGQTILDVGCGNGYHLWRMRESGAKHVLGIDPSLLYLKQFEAIQHYAQDLAVQFLPLPMEALPSPMAVFDTVFSMGVLYHRRSPHAHLQELSLALKPGGELVLETLIIPGDDDSSLAITGRYAKMRNIYELPTQKRLVSWIEAGAFTNVRTVSIDVTQCSEQRTTQWMPSHSLAEALDPANSEMTIESHPRPRRIVVLATRQE